MDFTQVTELQRVSRKDTDEFNDAVNDLLDKGYVILQPPFVTDETAHAYRLNVCDMGKLKVTKNETTIKD